MYLFYAENISCPPPPPGINTLDDLDRLQQNLTYGDIYTYSCREGYATTDDIYTVCQTYGNLSLTTPPTCTGNVKIIMILVAGTC